MFRESWLWASDKQRVQRFVTQSRLTQGVVQRFVAGEELEDAIRVIKDLNGKGIGGILDLLGEGVADDAGANAAAGEYSASIKRIASTGVDTSVSVKLTQLGLVLDKGGCIDRTRVLCAEAQSVGTSIEIDMEQSEYVADTIDVFKLLRTDFPDLRLALQAMLRRTPIDLENMAVPPPRIRLVKGAYAEPPEIAFQKAKEIDAQYRYITDWLFEKGDHPALATHDLKLIEHATHAADRTGKGLDEWEVQMLYGVRRELQESLATSGHRVKVYVPFGSAWYPYLMRRIAERPGNLRFFMRALVRK